MKNVAAAILVLAAAAPALAQGKPLAVVPGQTAALYQFDEGSGAVVHDLSGHECHGTLSGGSAWIATQNGSGVDFSDPTALMSLVKACDVGSTWTIQAWIRCPLAPISTKYKNRTLVHNQAWHHHVCTDENGVPAVTVPQHMYSCGGDPLPSEDWHLLSAVGTNNTTTFYLDNIRVGTPVGVQETSPIVFIGNYSGLDESWGAIDSLRILTVARSETEIASDSFQAPPPPPDPTLDLHAVNTGGSGNACSAGATGVGLALLVLGLLLRRA